MIASPGFFYAPAAHTLTHLCRLLGVKLPRFRLPLTKKNALTSCYFLCNIMSEPMACRSQRPEYYERVCSASANDGALRRRISFTCMVGSLSLDRLPIFLKKDCPKMKVVTINRLLLQKFQQDPEVLRKTARPCVLVVRLKYKGHKRSFAIPMRSNISARTPRNQYFALPTRSTTRPGNHHGLLAVASHFLQTWIF